MNFDFNVWLAVIGVPLLVFFMGVFTYWATRLGDYD
jgi:hypothetical protein